MKRRTLPDLVQEKRWLIFLIRFLVTIWAIVLLGFFFWSQFRFFAGRLEPILRIFGF